MNLGFQRIYVPVNPAEFGGDLVCHGALEIFREDAPGVGFDFKVLANVGVVVAPN